MCYNIWCPNGLRHHLKNSKTEMCVCVSKNSQGLKLSQGRTAAAQCSLFTHKSVPVIFEPPCNNSSQRTATVTYNKSLTQYFYFMFLWLLWQVH